MKHLLSLLFVLIPLSLFSQHTLIGKVIDGTTQEPLIGATIITKGTSIGTTTEWDGSFSITTEQDLIGLEITYV
jgi:hypothetical protein